MTKEERKIYRRDYYLKNKESARIQRAVWRKNNPGCRKNEYIKYDSPKRRYSSYRSGACSRNIVFDITFEFFNSFYNKDCSYCGSKIKAIGLDRVDNDKGYISGNIVSCCEMCNRMKLHHGKEVFIEHCRKIVNFNS